MIIKYINKILCAIGKHKLYETVGDCGTGIPSTGYECVRCKKNGGGMNLVKLVGGSIFCDSKMVANKFGMRHAKVVENIRRLIHDLKRFSVLSKDAKYIETESEYRGQRFKVYMMDRKFFSLLCMRFKGDKAFEWQLRFNDAFYVMEERLVNQITNKNDQKWISAREQGKQIRKKETDTIKEFVSYATNQGSRNAKFYYKHITKATYKALGLVAQKNPKLRESMNIVELSELVLAEQYAVKLLKKYMKTGMNYKDIYKFVRDDLVLFSNNLRIE